MSICSTAFVFAVMSLSAALAQTPATSPPQNAPSTPPAQTAEPSMVTQIENWTEAQWEAAKATWMRENAKWTECERQATDQKLTGRQSWVFLYKCMF
jgi:hypothetical protein